MTTLKELKDIVGPANVLSGSELSERPAGYCKTSQNADCLVKPQSVQELSALARYAKSNKLSLVPQGGLTGLVNGTNTVQSNIIVSFERMNQVVRVDPDQNVLIAQAGVRLQRAQEAAAEHQLTLGVDIPSRGSCTIGGIVSTNAGGIRVIRYGMTRENLLGLTVVLADGTIIDASNTLMKNNAGFDLKQLFVGSEGSLGMVAEAVFKLYPKPQNECTGLVAAKSVEDLIKLLALCRQTLGAQLLSFEAMWHDYYAKIVQDPNYGDAPLDTEYPIYGIVETGMDSSFKTSESDSGSPLEALLEDALDRGYIVDAVVAQSEKDRKNIWAIREVTDYTVDGHTDIHSYDVGFELKDISAFVSTLQTEMKKKWPDKPVYIFGHMGDGNLHIIIPLHDDEVSVTSQFDDVVYDTVAQFQNSTVSAEHGIGTLKKPYLARSRSSEQIKLMQLLKSTLDPDGVLNPGNILP